MDRPGPVRRSLDAWEALLRRAPRADRRAGSPDATMLQRVRWRLVAWSAGTTIVVIVLLGAAVYAAAASSLAANSRSQLQTRATSLERCLTGAARGPDDCGPALAFSIGGPLAGTFGYVQRPDGRVIGPPQDGLPDGGGLDAAVGGRDVREVRLDSTSFRVLSESFPTSRGTYVVQIAQDITSERRTLEVLLLVLGATGLLGLIGAMVVGAVYAERALVPIRDSIRRQREFAADASHEFRTPLAVIRSSVEHLERHRDEPVASVGDALGDIRDEVEHLTALVGDLLLLARTDSGVVELERQPLDLSDVAGEALSVVSGLAAARDVEILLDPEPAPVVGDPLRLRQLVTILVDNAIAHSPAGGAVTVVVRGGRDGTRLRIDDSGPGLLPDDIPRVFDRFWRASDAPAGGTGLGLAIARWIVERHGGSIAAANRPSGGATFEVRLPSAGQS
jgi:two-component system, OmpR family, sensor histidine kinase CiaH